MTVHVANVINRNRGLLVVLSLVTFTFFIYDHRNTTNSIEENREAPQFKLEEKENQIYKEETKDCLNFNINVDLSQHPCGLPDLKNRRKFSHYEQKPEFGDVRKFFEDDYANKRKSNQYDNDTICGWGSQKVHTRDMILILHNVVNKVKSILGKDKISFLDSSCGDMFWMPEFLLDRMGDVEFTGYDLSQGNIDNNVEKYGSKGWVFKQHDLVKDKIKINFDLILSRHTMMHLYFGEIMSVFRNLEESGSRFLLMTTHNNQKNEEQHGGRFRPVNFFKEPFCLDAPLCIAEDTKLGTLYIMLIDLRSIKDLVY